MKYNSALIVIENSVRCNCKQLHLLDDSSKIRRQLSLDFSVGKFFQVRRVSPNCRLGPSV